jgi:hypothetical protein
MFHPLYQKLLASPLWISKRVLLTVPVSNPNDTVESSSVNFILADINHSPSDNWVSVNVFDTLTDRALADRPSTDGLPVDGVDILSSNRLADDTNNDGLANGSLSKNIDTSSTDWLADRISADEINTSFVDCLIDRSILLPPILSNTIIEYIFGLLILTYSIDCFYFLINMSHLLLYRIVAEYFQFQTYITASIPFHISK